MRHVLHEEYDRTHHELTSKSFYYLIYIGSSFYRSNVEDIQSRFANLLISVKTALEDKPVKVEDVHQVLVQITGCERCLPCTSICEIFSVASARKLWDYNHHSPVEKLVKLFIDDHIHLMSDYKKRLSGFYVTTKLIDYINDPNLNQSRQRGPINLPLASYDDEYDSLSVKLETERNLSMLSLSYVQELWNSFAEEFRIPSLTAVIDKVISGCLEITWRIPPREAKLIATSAHKSTAFFLRHKIIYVCINGQTIYDTNWKTVQR